MNILDKIIQQKHIDIASAKSKVSLSELEQQLNHTNKGFVKNIAAQIAKKNPAVIAEIKKASPSKGVIRENFNPIAIAKSYAKADATCLSILTDEQFFQGSLEYLKQVRAIVDLPILRKDFIIDPYQIFEAKAAGADCILLIVAALPFEKLQILSKLAQELELDVLVEVHDADELASALKLDAQLIGINNRNLKTFKTSLNTTIELLPMIPKDRIVITESGIHTKDDVQKMLDHHVYGFLVGESMMREAEPGMKLRQLFFQNKK